MDNDIEWDIEDVEEVLSVCNRPDKPNLGSRPKPKKKVNKSKKKSDLSLFSVTIFKTTRNIIIQGSHRDYFAEKEYPWLRNLIDEEDIITSYNEATGEQIKPEELLADPENINNAEFINLDLGISTNSSINIDPSTPVNTRSLNTQQLKSINKQRVRQRMSLAAPVDVLKKAAKGKQSKKNDENVIISRLEHLEMLYSQMDNIIGNNFESIAAQEEIINKIVDSKFEEFKKDCSQQLINSSKVSDQKYESLEKLFHDQFTKIKNDVEKISGKIGTLNERCNNIERRLKKDDNDKRIITSLQQHQANDKVQLDLMNQQIRKCADDIKDVDHRLREEEEKIKTLKEIAQQTNIRASVKDTRENNKGNEVDQRQELEQEERTNHADKECKLYDIVVLMDSNRRFLNKKRLFPGKNVLIKPCGSLESASKILDSPDFDIRESLIIHTGVNDIENRDMDCQAITDCFKLVVEMAKDKFRNAAIYLSEVTPRMDYWNGKVQEVNEKIKEIRRPWLKTISHSNLSDKNTLS